MNRYKAVIFDFDGTLVNTRKFSDDFTENFLRQKAINTLNSKEFLEKISANALDEKIKKEYDQSYKYAQISGMELFQNVKETLLELKKGGHTLAVATSSPVERVREVLQHHNVLRLFDTIVGLENAADRKPNPTILNRTLEILGVKNIEAIYIGNHQQDVEAAKNANMDSVFFVENERYYELIKDWLVVNKPNYIIRDLSELIEKI